MDALRTKIADVLSERAGTRAEVTAIEPLVGGACQDNLRVEVTFASGDLAGAHKLVFRSDAGASLPGSIDRAQEFRVIAEARKRGVRTPEARFLCEGLLRDGAHGYFLDWAEGEAIGRKILTSPALEKAREGLAVELAEELAKIHSVTPDHAADLFTTGQNPNPRASPADAALSLACSMIDRMPEAHPALELCLAWLKENATLEDEEVVLNHGDFRTGNFLVAPSGLSAVLDWEFAHWGTREQDIAWLCLRDWRFGALDKPVGGFADRATFYEAYERASGRAVSPRAVHYWEVMGNVWWAAGCVYQGTRYTSGERRDFELVSIARRSAEMEWEALRLLERAP